MTNHRLTFAASIAVLAAALSLHSLLYGSNWFIASIGAVAVAALAGSLTRMATVHAAIAACVAVLIGIVPVLAGFGWPGGVLAVVVLAITAAAATGARAPRLFAGLVTYVGLELVYLSAVFAGSSSWGRIVPTEHSLSDLASLPAGTRADFKFLPPITASRPVEFVTVMGVALIAICVDILAVRLRRPALAGLPLLLLFSVPVATSLKNFGIVQTLLFGLAISAYLSLLSVDGRQRLRMWGRLVTIRRTLTGEEPGQGPDTRQIAASGRRVGLTAVGVAMVLPLILAGGTPKDLFAKTPTGGTGPGLGVGLGGTAPLVAISNDLGHPRPTEVLTYQTTASKPRGQYLQEYVLNYVGTSWALTTSSTGEAVRGETLPYKPPGLGPAVPTSSVTTTISMDVATGRAALPIPYAPVKISASNAALTETAGTLMVYNLVASPTFTVTSDEPNPGPGQLDLSGRPPPDIVTQYGGYSGPDKSKLLAIAQAETKGQTTALGKANALQQWFTSPYFTYTVHARWPNSGPWLQRFLTTDPHGDCSQFAPAFAVLARLLGIPSRVAIGFTAGNRESGSGTWRVTTADAHAWPELYFPQVGWIRFEPTPSGIGEQGTASPPSYTQSGSSSANGSKPTKPTKPAPGAGQKAKANNGLNSKLSHLGGPDGGGATAASHRGGSGLALGITLAVVLFALLAWPRLARWVTTRRRWMTAAGDAGRASTAWRELLDYLTDYGIEWFPSESPRAIATRITGTAGLGPAGAAAIARIGAAEERSRYARTPVPGAGLRADVITVRRALAASATRIGRLRARLLPASTLASVRRGLQLANRAFSWIDSPLPSMRRASGRSELRKAD
jgi:transglutaminase-like putative cysteine protease